MRLSSPVSGPCAGRGELQRRDPPAGGAMTRLVESKPAPPGQLGGPSSILAREGKHGVPPPKMPAM